MINIRYALEDDLDAVNEIENQSSSLWKPSYFIQEIENSFSHFLIAETNNRIVGFIVGWLVADQFEIQNIAVHRDFRRKGIASQMIKYLISIPIQNKIKKILLEVKESNTIALSFYQSIGFNQVGIRKNYYSSGDHAILMENKSVNEL